MAVSKRKGKKPKQTFLLVVRGGEKGFLFFCAFLSLDVWIALLFLCVCVYSQNDDDDDEENDDVHLLGVYTTTCWVCVEYCREMQEKNSIRYVGFVLFFLLLLTHMSHFSESLESFLFASKIFRPLAIKHRTLDSVNPR